MTEVKFNRERRWSCVKPKRLDIYDTGIALDLLRKKSPRAIIGRAARIIRAEMFATKNGEIIRKGLLH